MKEIRTGSILFNKHDKTFDDGNGYGVNQLSEAYIYGSEDIAKLNLEQCFDSPEDYEIWNVEIEIKTV